MDPLELPNGFLILGPIHRPLGLNERFQRKNPNSYTFQLDVFCTRFDILIISQTLNLTKAVQCAQVCLQIQILYATQLGL